MEQNVLQYFAVFRNGNQQEQQKAFEHIMAELHEPVDWTYAVWEKLVSNLTSNDAYKRSYSARLLCALAAKSDPEERVFEDFASIWKVTFIEPYALARKSLQAIWKIGTAGKVQRELVIAQLVNRYINCLDEQYCQEIRLDIIESLHKLFKATGDKRIEEIAKSLIEQQVNIQ